MRKRRPPCPPHPRPTRCAGQPQRCCLDRRLGFRWSQALKQLHAGCGAAAPRSTRLPASAGEREGERMHTVCK
jgi:hypothetical protein